MARELGGRGITVKYHRPGAIATDFGGGLVRDDAEVNAQFCRHDGAGRVGVPEDIGPMIASLLRDDNRWVTAQRIEVSGGQTI
ncbi:putative dehydrogenase/reductase oxidoreductase protein [Klebsiella pneumoniae]|nr:putative dehydrogenase/reductase oxidoreductase protein [Klebsiella pneumoniae]